MAKQLLTLIKWGCAYLKKTQPLVEIDPAVNIFSFYQNPEAISLP